MSFNLKRFDPSKMKDDKVCVFIGKRGTGKSTLVTDILWHKKNIPAGIAMSGTEDGNGHYKQFIPDLFVYSDYNREAIEKIMDRQRKIAARVGKEKLPPVFILMDDCMYDRAFMRDTVMRNLFMNGRHWNIFFMMTTQYVMDMTPMIRSNTDYVFVLRDNVKQNRENLYKCFFGMFPSFDSFCQVMDACTENYECLVLDNTCKTNRIQDMVFWYKAPIRKNFRVGSPAFWQYHNRHYNPRHQVAPQPAGAPPRARGAPTIVVKKTR
jgi:hypothetical protein